MVALRVAHVVLTGIIFITGYLVYQVDAFHVATFPRIPGSIINSKGSFIFSRLRDNTQLNAFKFFRNGKLVRETKITVVDDDDNPIVTPPLKVFKNTNVSISNDNNLQLKQESEVVVEEEAAPSTIEEGDIVIIGGGVSGLTAAITAAAAIQKKKTSNAKIVLLEANGSFGGRVASERTDDGFVLDKGFAVFIEEYPYSKMLLDYDDLKLKPFLPGALVKLEGSDDLARISDPIREPSDLYDALVSPVGSPGDKLAMVPLLLNVRLKSIAELFEEFETDTATALKSRWRFSNDIITKFFKPFLEGIYLSPLPTQSSRMFSFVMKMFAEGSATLPEGGMQAVADQLAARAKTFGVDLRTNSPVSSVKLINEDGDSSIMVHMVETIEGETQECPIKANYVVVATDGQVAQQLISNIDGFESLEYLPQQPQRSVGCVYYTFEGPAPVSEPILILNGIGGDDADSPILPVNNVCFPSIVNEGYAPKGSNLCSVTVLSGAMEFYKGKEDELDMAVRKQLGTWFTENQQEILEKWKLKKIFNVSDAI